MSINRTEQSQKSFHLKKEWSIWDHETKTYETENSTLWDRGRDQDQLLWDQDQKDFNISASISAAILNKSLGFGFG